MCLIFEVSKSGYYAWLKRPKSQREQENEQLEQLIKDAFRQSRQTYGSLRITAALKAKGVSCSHNRVARLMGKLHLASKVTRKFKATTNSKHHLPTAANLLNRAFNPKQPNQVWVADITYVPTGEGWLYLAAVEDLGQRKVVGWAMDKTMTEDLVNRALKQAIGRTNPPTGVIHHSDRGAQYASKAYQQLLASHGFLPSMSRKGNCYDNACMESFFGTLKKELIYPSRYRTRDEARLSIFEYIEIFYNRIRLHSKLGYKSPEDYERGLLSA
jgi:transposase InsO family protein